MKVGDVMTGRVRTCSRTDSLAVVMRTLWEQDLGALPVVNDAGQPIAMITDRDVAVAAYTQGKPLHEIAVQTAMSKVVHTAHVSDPLSAAERTMRAHQLHRLPVVDESTRLIGVLSLNDIALSLTRATPPRLEALGDVALTVAAIARRRSATSTPQDDKPQRDGSDREGQATLRTDGAHSVSPAAPARSSTPVRGKGRPTTSR